MNKAFTISLFVAAAGLVAGLVWYFWLRHPETGATLALERPTTGYLAQSITATGTIQPVDTVAVGAQVTGIIKVLNADFNSRVKKGQLLAQLDQSLFQAAVDQATAALQTARSQLHYQQLNYRRQQALHATGAISDADYQLATNAYQAALAGAAGAGAQLRSARRNLSYTTIHSPITGTVLLRRVSLGQTVVASFNTPTLFSIAKDVTRMQVQASIDEADIGNVKPGQRASFVVDAFPNDVFEGTVQEVRLHPRVSSNVVTYTTIIGAPNDSLKLLPGMTANITVYTKEVPDALQIPAKALLVQPDSTLGSQYTWQPAPPARPPARNMRKGQATPASPPRKTTYVWVKRGQALVQTPIQTGISDNLHVQVLAGLRPQDEVVSAVQAGASAAAKPVAGSPFIPKRPGGGPRR